jgi:hypothetical protein
MISRYDIMKESSVLDTDTTTFPDPLSINFNDLKLTTSPYKKRLDSRQINKPWLIVYEVYNRTDSEDMILNLNGVAFYPTLEPGDDIYIPTLADINTFISKMKTKNGKQ